MTNFYKNRYEYHASGGHADLKLHTINIFKYVGFIKTNLFKIEDNRRSPPEPL